MLSISSSTILAPTPGELIDSLYRRGTLTPHSSDALVDVVLTDAGWDMSFRARALAAHACRRYEAETGLPF